nr:hypothetical protein [Chloroflexaceae bacterium]
MPGILILHASLGTGHTTAAAALEEAFARLSDIPVQSEDVLDYTGAVLRTALTAAYEGASERSPQLYRLLYSGTDSETLDDAFSGNRLLSALERPFLAQLEGLIHQVAPDAIICVHPIAAHVLASRVQEGSLATPMYVVVTDFLAHSTWLVPGVKRYFLPSPFTRRILLKRGVAAEATEITGIPIRLQSTEPKSPQEMRQRHELPTDQPVIALFGGGIEPQRVR